MKKSLLSGLPVVALMAGLALPSLADDAKTYKLKLHRPPAAGHKAQLHCKVTGESSMKVAMEGTKPSSNTDGYTGEIAGIVEILEVSPQGNPQKLKFTIGEFSLEKESGEESKPFEAGTIVTGTLGEDGKETFTTADGEEIDEMAMKVLKEVVDMRKDQEGASTDDVIFRTSEPRAPGSEWEMDKAALLKTLPPDMPLVLKEEDIEARVKFVEVKMVEGIECAVLRPVATMTASGFKGLPPNFKGTKMVLSVTGEMYVPLDEAAFPPAEKVKMEMNMTGEIRPPDGQPGPAAEMESFELTERELKTQAVK